MRFWHETDGLDVGSFLSMIQWDANGPGFSPAWPGLFGFETMDAVQYHHLIYLIGGGHVVRNRRRMSGLHVPGSHKIETCNVTPGPPRPSADVSAPPSVDKKAGPYVPTSQAWRGMGCIFRAKRKKKISGAASSGESAGHRRGQASPWSASDWRLQIN